LFESLDNIFDRVYVFDCMGFLYESEPLSWEMTIPHLGHLRRRGLEQFLRLYRSPMARREEATTNLRWGDEVEYGILAIKDDSVDLSLRGAELIRNLRLSCPEFAWQPEYGAWMVEATPARPFGDTTV